MIASAFIVQYSSTGAVNWRAYVDAASSTDFGYSVAVDSVGNVYLAGGNGTVAANVYNSSGTSTISVPINSAFLVKYNSAGNVVWRAYIDSGALAETAYAVKTDAQDNVYISGGNSTNTATLVYNSNIYGTNANVYLSSQAAFLVKYDSTGKYIWNSQVDSQAGASNDIGYGLSTDAQNNVYMIGNNPLAANIYNSSGLVSPLFLPASSAYIVKYNSDGNIDNQPGFRRWPPNEITYQNWSGTAPSFTYSMTNQGYGNGTYNITATAASAVNYDARCVFDNSAVTDTSIGYYNTVVPAFIRIQLPVAVVIQLYAIYPLMYGGAFTAWTFDGSNNGSTWNTLDTRTGVAMTNNGGGWWSYVNNTVAYSYYRINFTAGAGYVRNWRMYDTVTNYITNNLFMYYDFSRESYSGSGTTLVDKSPNSLNGTFVNLAGLVYTSTSPQYMTWTSSSSLSTTTFATNSFPFGITYEILVYPTSFAGGPTIIDLLTSAGGHNNIYLSTGGGVGFQNGTLTAAGVVTLNTWNHIAISYTSSTNVIVYVNSVSRFSGSAGIFQSNNTTFVLNNYGTSGSFAMLGRIGFARIYNRPLSAAEVLANYNDAKRSPNPYALP